MSERVIVTREQVAAAGRSEGPNSMVARTLKALDDLAAKRIRPPVRLIGDVYWIGPTGETYPEY